MNKRDCRSNIQIYTLLVKYTYNTTINMPHAQHSRIQTLLTHERSAVFVSPLLFIQTLSSRIRAAPFSATAYVDAMIFPETIAQSSEK